VLEAVGLASHADIVSLVLILVLLVAFASEVFRTETIAIAGMAACLLLGLVDTSGMLTAMANSAPWTIIAMFILSGALVRTGLLADLADQLGKLKRLGRTASIGAFLLTIIVVSAFMNNTALVVMMIPVAFSLAQTLDIAASRLLLPLSFAAILGGTCTLIGTSTNLLVDGLATEAGLAPFGLFEISGLGLAVAGAGGFYMAIAARHLLPNRLTVSESIGSKPKPSYLVEV